MNTDKVFTAFDKEGKELLLYRKDNNTYIDLNSDNNEIIEKDKIDLETLVFARKSVNLHKHMLASSIKRKYKKDREQLLNTKEQLIGLKVIVRNYETWCTGKGIFNIVKHHKWEETPNTYDLYNFIDRIKINYDTILDLYNNINNEEFLGFKVNDEPDGLYDMPNFRNGKEYVIIKDNLSSLTGESYLDKKKIYEIGYKLRKNLLK